MIKNNSQLTQAKQMLKKYIEQKDAINGQDLIERMQLTAFICRIENLEQDIKEYESLIQNSGELQFDSETLSKAIMSLRIASGYTQKELAQELDIPEQQVQRYEQQDYLKVKFERIIQIMHILSTKINLSFQIKGLGKIIPIKRPIKEKIHKIQERGYLLNFGE